MAATTKGPTACIAARSTPKPTTYGGSTTKKTTPASQTRHGPSSPPERPAAPTAGIAEAKGESRVHAVGSAIGGTDAAALRGRIASKGYGQAAIGRPFGN